MKVKCEFSGGLETLFENQKNLTVELPESSTIAELIKCLKTGHLKKNPELFVNNDDNM
jgi:hypothetical protein